MPLAASQSLFLIRRPRAFSLIEVLLAIFILGIGVIGIAALFPAGIAQQQRSVDDVMGPIVANNALTILRSKLSQDDFGSFEDFGDSPPEFNTLPTIVGDWFWRRPAVMYQDDTSNNFDRDERGAIDIFGYVNTGFWAQGNPSFSEVDAAAEDSSGSGPIPFNPAKWFNPAASTQRTPSIVFTQGERMYPMSDRVRNVGIQSTPQYYWDCMFRKFQGKVLVAIFVYRVVVPGGEDYIYSVPKNIGVPGVPLVPYHLALTDISASMPWDSALNTWEINQSLFPESTPAQIPETGAGGVQQLYDLGPNMDDASEPVLFKAPGAAWQMTGQWFIDQNNNVHRVLTGREKSGADNRNRPVELVDRIPAPLPNGYSGSSVYFFDRAPAGGAIAVGAENIVTNIWYLPRYVEVSVGGAPLTISIIPVFATVEEL